MVGIHPPGEKSKKIALKENGVRLDNSPSHVREEIFMENEIIKLNKKRYKFHIIAEKTKIEMLDKELPTRVLAQSVL